jgi:uncharacterized membrane protein
MDEASKEPRAPRDSPPNDVSGERAPGGGGFEAFESYPLTRPEYISAMVHFYRAEVHRSQAWRARLDTTTNWAVVTVAGMISFSLSSPDHSPLTLLLGAVLVTNFLLIEASRYRYFAVFRARVRMIEENFYLPLIRRDLTSPKEDWRVLIARDLDEPKFKTTYLEAVLFRLGRNYLWLYLIILATWLMKLSIHPDPVTRPIEFYQRMALGPLPAWFVLGVVLAVYLTLFILLMTPLANRAATDEVHGLERERSHWKV